MQERLPLRYRQPRGGIQITTLRPAIDSFRVEIGGRTLHSDDKTKTASEILKVGVEVGVKDL